MNNLAADLFIGPQRAISFISGAQLRITNKYGQARAHVEINHERHHTIYQD
jgi:hypothetical protein